MTSPRVFITHRHRYAEDFRTVKQALRRTFRFADLSVHNHRFIEDELPLEFLVGSIYTRIQTCNVFVAIGRRYVGRAVWCQWEIDHAISMGKYIAVYRPLGADHAEAPAAIRRYPLYIGPFTQARRLGTMLRERGFTVTPPPPPRKRS